MILARGAEALVALLEQLGVGPVATVPGERDQFPVQSLKGVLQRRTVVLLQDLWADKLL